MGAGWLFAPDQRAAVLHGLGHVSDFGLRAGGQVGDGSVQQQEYRDNGVYVRGIVDRRSFHLFEPYLLKE